MKWINVKDKLPEIPEDLCAVKVLVAEYDPGCKQYTVHECMFGKYPKSELWPASTKNDFMTIYFGTDVSWGPTADIVTHWMYLPEPPKYLVGEK